MVLGNFPSFLSPLASNHAFIIRLVKMWLGEPWSSCGEDQGSPRLKISLDWLMIIFAKREFSRLLSCHVAVSIVMLACESTFASQKGHSDHDYIHWVDPGLATVCQILVGKSGQVLGVLGWPLTRIGAVQVVRFESSDKHEPSLTLRVALNKSLPRLIWNTLVFRTVPAVSV